MEQYYIILVDLFDVIRHPLSRLIQSLGFVDYSGLLVCAIIVFIIKFVDVLIGQCLVVEGNWVLI